MYGSAITINLSEKVKVETSLNGLNCIDRYGRYDENYYANVDVCFIQIYLRLNDYYKYIYYV